MDLPSLVAMYAPTSNKDDTMDLPSLVGSISALERRQHVYPRGDAGGPKNQSLPFIYYLCSEHKDHLSFSINVTYAPTSDKDDTMDLPSLVGTISALERRQHVYPRGDAGGPKNQSLPLIYYLCSEHKDHLSFSINVTYSPTSDKDDTMDLPSLVGTIHA